METLGYHVSITAGVITKKSLTIALANLFFNTKTNNDTITTFLFNHRAIDRLFTFSGD